MTTTVTFLEKAKSIKKLIELRGWNPFIAARNLGINQMYLQHLLSLVEAPKEIKEMVKEYFFSPLTYFPRKRK